MKVKPKEVAASKIKKTEKEIITLQPGVLIEQTRKPVFYHNEQQNLFVFGNGIRKKRTAAYVVKAQRRQSTIKQLVTDVIKAIFSTFVPSASCGTKDSVKKK